MSIPCTRNFLALGLVLLASSGLSVGRSTSLGPRLDVVVVSSEEILRLRADFRDLGDERCTVLHVSPEPRGVHVGPGDDQQHSGTQAVLDVPTLEDNSKRDRLRFTTDCVVVFVHGSSSSNSTTDDVVKKALLFVSVFGRRAAVIDLGSTQPNPEVMRESNAEVLFLQRLEGGGHRSVLVQRSCPKVMTNPLPAIHPKSLLVVRRGGAARSWPLRQPGGDECPNPMMGQTLPCSLVPTIPFVIMAGGAPSGFMIDLYTYLAKKFSFRPRIKIEFRYLNKDESYRDHKARRSFVEVGTYRPTRRFAESYPIHFGEMVFLSRKPRPIDNLSKAVRPFSTEVWASLGVTILALACLMMAAHHVYSDLGSACRHLIRSEHSYLNFIIFPFAKLSEPDPLPWFTLRFSAGKVAVGLWVLLQTSLVMFYQVNLRAHLIAQTYERPLDTLQDIVDHGGRTWIFNNVIQVRQDFMEREGMTGDVRYQVALLANRTDGYFDPYKTRGLPEGMGKDLQENRSVLLLPNKDTGLYGYFHSREDFARDRLHVSKESMFTLYATLRTLKTSPAFSLFNEALMSAHATGLLNKFMSDPLPLSQLAAEFKRDESQILDPLLPKDVALMAALWLAGIAAAAAVFCREVGSCWRKAGAGGGWGDLVGTWKDQAAAAAAAARAIKKVAA